MDRIRSFFDDLGLFDEEDKNRTDSDKSSIDTKSIDIEDDIEAPVTAVTVVAADAVSPPSVLGSNRRKFLLTRNPSLPRAKSRSIRHITNSMVEEEEDDDDDDKDECYDDNDGKMNEFPRHDVSGLKKGSARSFTRFRYRSRSLPSANASNENVVSNTKDLVSCKTVIPDDSAVDETPANLFGYACGVEFCTSMELMDKIQGNGNADQNTNDDDEDDSILEHNQNTDSPLHSKPMEKKRSFLWRNKSIGTESNVAMTKTKIIPIDSKTVMTEATGDSNSSSTITKTHLRRWGHSKFWTLTALVFALTGCICAILTRQSLHFVTLREPLIITEMYEPIYHMGMIRVQICTNTSATTSSTVASLTESGDGILNISTTMTSTTSASVESSDCTITRFTREEVNDHLFNLSRSLLTMGSFLGIALTLVLTTSIVWETINLRPIAIGFLVAYFFQSFSMLFFDTELCREYKCQMDSGGYLSITTSICWIVTLIAVVRMDLFKLQSIRSRRREERKAKREARRQERKALALRKRQQREQLMIIDNFQKNTTQSVDMLDIEAVLTSDAEHQTAVTNKHDKRKMTL